MENKSMALSVMLGLACGFGLMALFFGITYGLLALFGHA